MRLVLGILTLILAGWFLSALVGTPESTASAGTPTEWISSQQCAECHQQLYDEWASSPHANSWNNEDVRAQSGNFTNEVCIDCHAARPVFEEGVGKRPMPRSARRSEGVDCLTCHLTPDGGMAGTITNPRAACQPVIRRELQRVSLCAGCHDQHKTVQQWKETPHAENRDGCMECHMPYRVSGVPESGRVHVMPGGHYIEMVRSAVEMTAERDADGVPQVTLINKSGHAYPTDERSRASDLWWRIAPTDDSAEAGPWQHRHRIRDPYRRETGIESTLLHYGEVRTLAIPDEGARVAIEVMLVYKRTPYYRAPETGLAMALERVTDPLEDAEIVHQLILEP